MTQSVFTVDLSGRKALVTGGSRGIGLSAAKFLVRAGCQVAIVYRRRQREARRQLRAPLCQPINDRLTMRG